MDIQSVPPHQAFQIVAYASVAVRLFKSRLISSYPQFFVLVIFEFLRSASTLVIRHGTNAHGYLYFFSQPVAWTLHALVVLEIFRMALRSHPGIASLGRRVVRAGVAVAAAISTATLFVRAEMPESAFVTLERYILFERLIYSTLLGFLLVLLLFLAYFPVPLPRNALLHAGVFGMYFLARTALWAIRNVLGPQFTATLNLAMASVVIGCLLIWAVFLSAKGESRSVRSSRRSDPVAEERLIAQLEAINSTLLRSVRK